MNYNGNTKYKSNELIQLTFKFSVSTIKYCRLLNEKREFILSKQLLRSGTSIGANLREAQNAESKRDFIHKLKIAIKEADETEYWLLLLCETEEKDHPQKLLNELEVILKILNKSISTLNKKIEV